MFDAFMDQHAPQIIELAIDLTFKSLIILAIAHTVCLLFHRASAAYKHLFCSIAFITILLLPLSYWLAPQTSWSLLYIDIPVTKSNEAPVTIKNNFPIGTDVLPKTFEVQTINSRKQKELTEFNNPSKLFLPLSMEQPSPLLETSPPARLDTFEANTFSPAALETTPPTEITENLLTPAASTLPLSALAQESDRPATIRWAGYLLVIWFLGVSIFLGQLIFGMLLTRIVIGKCRKVTSGPLDLKFKRLLWGLGIERKVQLYCGKSEKSNVASSTFGILKPTVLVPCEANEWSFNKLRTVLLHELIHIKRLDWLWIMIGHIACALYWFNPMVWVLFRRMNQLSEQACDNKVILSGINPAYYATELIESIRAVKSRLNDNSLFVTMAQESQISERLTSILRTSENREGLNGDGISSAIGVALAIITPLILIATVSTPTSIADKEKIEIEHTEYKDFDPGDLAYDSIPLTKDDELLSENEAIEESSFQIDEMYKFLQANPTLPSAGITGQPTSQHDPVQANSSIRQFRFIQFLKNSTLNKQVEGYHNTLDKVLAKSYRSGQIISSQELYQILELLANAARYEIDNDNSLLLSNLIHSLWKNKQDLANASSNERTGPILISLPSSESGDTIKHVSYSYQQQTVKFIKERRFQHALIAIQFYKILANGERDPLYPEFIDDLESSGNSEIAGNVYTIASLEKLAKRYITQVEKDLRAVKKIYEHGYLLSAVDQLQTPIFFGEFLPAVNNIDYWQKLRMAAAYSDYQTIQGYLQQKDYSKAKAAINQAKRYIADLPVKELLDQTESEMYASSLALFNANKHFQNQNANGFIRAINRARKHWPFNPEIQDTYDNAIIQMNNIKQGLGLFDKLHKSGAYRKIVEHRDSLAQTLRHYPKRKAKLNQAIKKIQAIDKAISQSEQALVEENYHNAWDILEFAKKFDANDIELKRLQTKVASEILDYTYFVNNARIHEKHGDFAPSLAHYLTAQVFYPESRLCDIGISRTSSELLTALVEKDSQSPTQSIAVIIP